jgi:hypothetical protein
MCNLHAGSFNLSYMHVPADFSANNGRGVKTKCLLGKAKLTGRNYVFGSASAEAPGPNVRGEEHLQQKHK